MLEANVSFDAARVTEELRKAEQALHTLAASPTDGRVLAWSPELFPVAWLRERLGLSVTEQRVLWLLIAYELSPDARRWLRDLGTEDVVDPTLDAIRRVVYGSGPNANERRSLPGCKRRFATSTH